ncbi:MAG: hypothetical protein GW859_04415 [Sphingomonadales bacterium]|nr:hypothetical protein [Sphingomonadales bacterium]
MSARRSETGSHDDGARGWLASYRVALVGGLIALLAAATLASDFFGTAIIRLFFIEQDRWFLPLLALVAMALRRAMLPQSGVPAIWNRAMAPTGIALIAVALLLAAYLGHDLAMAGYDLSRDEQMARFDAWIFAHGSLAWPVPPSWRGDIAALNGTFLLVANQPTGWVSAYLPVNAAFHATVGLVADPALTNPVLLAVGFVALWRIALRLWPDDRIAQATALALYLGSSQIVVASMTAYAMTGHLALNLLWLLFFLRGRLRDDIVAVVIGCAASGLHQLLFHPLFVAPFVLMLAMRREWRRCAFYCLAYLVIGAIWFAWPIWMSASISGAGAAAGGGVSFADRLVAMLGAVGIANGPVMVLNIARFVAWQHLAFLPFVAAGLVVAWRRGSMARALAAATLLPFIVMAVLLAYQGHGWGYRYAHGVIGAACLIGGFGAQELRRRGVEIVAFLGWTTAASIAVSLPVHAWMAHRLVAPYAAVDAAIRDSDAEVALIDTRAAPFANDLVLNAPDLGNRPLRLRAASLSNAQIAQLCVRRRAMVVDGAALASIVELFDAKTGSDARLSQCDPKNGDQGAK